MDGGVGVLEDCPAKTSKVFFICIKTKQIAYGGISNVQHYSKGKFIPKGILNIFFPKILCGTDWERERSLLSVEALT